MTREEAAIHIGTLRTVTKDIPKYSGKAIDEAVDMAIKALEQESVLDEIKEEIRNWYWQSDKQALATDPCVVDAMIDLFIRTINKYQTESEGKE